MAEYIKTFGDTGWTAFGTWTSVGAGGWYNGDYHKNLEAATLDAYVEAEFNVPSGYYDLYCHAPGLGGSHTPYRMITVTDGNNLNTQRVCFFNHGDSFELETFSTGGNYWQRFALSVPCSGTMTIRQERDYRAPITNNGMIIDAMAMVTTTGIPEVAVEEHVGYTPTSNRSKPHPLSTN